MNTRMEKVAEDVALAALRKVGSSIRPPLQQEQLKSAFGTRWPVPGSNMPMNDAMGAALDAVAANTPGQDKPHAILSEAKKRIEETWSKSVEEVVQEYFKSARHSFEKGEPLDGAETLTDAVRATLGHIAAVRNWPHGAHDDLYCIAAALGSGQGWPNTPEEFDQALNNRSEEGFHLGAALGASMGRSRSIKFGTYAENPDEAEEDGFLFAETTIELANRLAKQVTP